MPKDEVMVGGKGLPADDLSRFLTVVNEENDRNLPHIALAGDTYTITVSGEDTNGRFCIIDMLVHPGGGPAPHRHDFEETFVLLEGEIVVTFRGEEMVVRAPGTINIPANAPHRFRNATQQTARMLCICAPAGQDEFFQLIGTAVATRTSKPATMNGDEQQAFREKMLALAPRYRTEVLEFV